MLRLMRSLALPSSYLVAAAAACSASGPPPIDAPPPEYQRAADTAQAPVAPAPTSTQNAIASPAPAPAGPAACSEGMVLVEGEYCSDVEQKCLVEWYAPQNNKLVCEQFEAPSKCIGNKVNKRFCIDKYAYPNKEGARPEVMDHFYQMQVKCAARGKRICTETEWTFACEGPEMKPFPHGYVRDPAKCNGDHGWDSPNMQKVARRDPAELARLWRGVPSGSQPDCVSDFGVHDLPGNNDEFVSGDSHKAKFNSVNTGGPWYSGVRNQCRPKVYTHEEGFYYYFLGFRCCAEPDGKPTDPRTKKQKAENWDVSRIERLAGFTIEQMKQVDALREKGECKCGPRNSLPGVELKKSPSWLCDTMCGTLLGPNAKDGDESTRLRHKKRKEID